MSSNFTIVQGDTAILQFSVTDEDGAALDVSTASAITFEIAVSASESALVTKTLDDGISVATSTVTVTLSPSDTAALLGRYVMELQITDADGNVFTPLQGKARILRGLIT